jgi:hypothetical protein
MNSRMVDRGLLFACAILMALSGDAPCHEFHVAGSLNIRYARSWSEAHTCQMELDYRECQWRVVQTWASATNRIVVSMSDDTRALYTLTHVERLTPGIGNGRSATILPNSRVAAMEQSGFPYRTFNPEIEFLFYAYLSSCYLNSVSDGRAAPIKCGASDLLMGDARVPIKVERHPEAPQLPVRLTLYHAASDNTNAVIEASGFMNVGGAMLPASVVLRRYAHNRDALIALYEFKAEIMRSHTAIRSFTPEFPSKALVADHRFSRGQADVPPITYGFVTAGWPSETEATNHPTFQGNQMDWEAAQRAAATGGMKSEQLQARRTWVILLLILASMPFFIILCFSSRRQRRNA